MGDSRLSDVDAIALLALAVRDLEGVVLPALPDGTARFTGDLIVKLLQLIYDRLSHGPELTREFQNTLADVSRLLGVDEPGATELARIGPAVARRAAENRDIPWADLIRLGEAEEVLAQGGRLRSMMESFAEAGAGAARQRERSVGDPMTLDADRFEAIVRVLPETIGARVTGWREIGSGTQKTIFLAEFTCADGRREWVLRQDKNFTSFGLSVMDEAPIIRMVQEVAVCAPRLLWSSGPLEGIHPFIATGRLEGAADFANWSRRPDAAQTGKQIAGIMAALHRAPVLTLPPRQGHLPGSVGNTPVERVAHLRAYRDRIGGPPRPLVDACFAWLEREAPEDFTAVVPVHGDFALHNVLVHDGRVTGVLDWEFAHFGDPHEDLSYIRPFIGTLMPWTDYVAAYEEAGGIRFDARAAHWWGVLGMLRLALGCFYNLEAVRSGRADLDIRVANPGYFSGGPLLLDAARMIAAGPSIA